MAPALAHVPSRTLVLSETAVVGTNPPAATGKDTNEKLRCNIGFARDTACSRRMLLSYRLGNVKLDNGQVHRSRAVHITHMHHGVLLFTDG